MYVQRKTSLTRLLDFRKVHVQNNTKDTSNQILGIKIFTTDPDNIFRVSVRVRVAPFTEPQKKAPRAQTTFSKILSGSGRRFPRKTKTNVTTDPEQIFEVSVGARVFVSPRTTTNVNTGPDNILEVSVRAQPSR